MAEAAELPGNDLDERLVTVPETEAELPRVKVQVPVPINVPDERALAFLKYGTNEAVDPKDIPALLRP